MFTGTHLKRTVSQWASEAHCRHNKRPICATRQSSSQTPKRRRNQRVQIMSDTSCYNSPRTAMCLRQTVRGGLDICTICHALARCGRFSLQSRSFDNIQMTHQIFPRPST